MTLTEELNRLLGAQENAMNLLPSSHWNELNKNEHLPFSSDMEYMNLVNVVFTIRHAILELEERITTEASQPRVRARTNVVPAKTVLLFLEKLHSIAKRMLE